MSDTTKKWTREGFRVYDADRPDYTVCVCRDESDAEDFINRLNASADQAAENERLRAAYGELLDAGSCAVLAFMTSSKRPNTEMGRLGTACDEAALVTLCPKDSS